jgi:hypothetical protein
VENSEILLTAGSRRSRGEVNPSAIAYRRSTIDEVRRRLVEVTSCDFSSHSEALISVRQVARDPSAPGFNAQGFQQHGNLASWIHDP